MNDSVEARAIADVMGRHDHITVTYMPAMIRIDGIGKMNSRWMKSRKSWGGS